MQPCERLHSIIYKAQKNTESEVKLTLNYRIERQKVKSYQADKNVEKYKHRTGKKTQKCQIIQCTKGQRCICSLKVSSPPSFIFLHLSSVWRSTADGGDTKAGSSVRSPLLYLQGVSSLLSVRMIREAADKSGEMERMTRCEERKEEK